MSMRLTMADKNIQLFRSEFNLYPVHDPNFPSILQNF